jgi:hypothetical protein
MEDPKIVTANQPCRGGLMVDDATRLCYYRAAT